MRLTIGFEFQCTNDGMHLVFRDQDGSLSYTDQKKLTYIGHGTDFAATGDRISRAEDRARIFDHVAKIRDNLTLISDSGTTSVIRNEDLRDIMDNELEFITTFASNPRNVDDNVEGYIWGHLSLGAGMIAHLFASRSDTIERVRLVGRHAGYAPFRLMMDLGDDCRTRGMPHIDRTFVAMDRFNKRSFMDDLRFNCQMTIGIPLQHVVDVLSKIIHMFRSYVASARDEEEEKDMGRIEETAALLDTISGLRMDRLQKSVLFLVVYHVQTIGKRKTMPFIMRHHMMHVLGRLPTRLVDKIVNQATRIHPIFKDYYQRLLEAPVQQHRRLQSLDQTGVYTVDKDKRILIEFRYLARILSRRLPTLRNGQTLTDLIG